MEILQDKIDELILDKKTQEIQKNELFNNLNKKLSGIQELKQIVSTKKIIGENSQEKIKYLTKLMEEFQITDIFKKKLNDFANVLLAREKTHVDLPFGPTIDNFIPELVEKLNSIEQELNSKLEEMKQTNNQNLEVDIKNLEKINEILNSENQKENVTEEMLSSLVKYFDLVNLTNISKEEAMEIISLLYKIKNFKKESNTSDVIEPEEKKKVSSTEIIELLNKYVSERTIKGIKRIIEPDTEKTDKEEDKEQKEIQKNEILEDINLENAEEILNFFKEKNITDRFSATSLIGIITYSDKEIVTNVYNKIMQELKEVPDNSKNKYFNMFFKDAMKSVWIVSGKGKTSKQQQFLKKRINKKDKNQAKTIGEECYSGNTLDDYFETRKLLDENESMFAIKIRGDRYGETLTMLSCNPKIVAKNIKLCKIFKLNEFDKIPCTSILKTDLEDKIHMAIELGLLKPPMNDEFKKLDDSIIKNDRFQANRLAEGIDNQSIRQYYQRNLTVIQATSTFDFAAFSKRLNEEGFIGFYNYFFSSKQAGYHDRFKIEEDNRNIDERIFDEFEIPTNDEYNAVINSDVTFYRYNENLFNDPLIKFLEENYTIIDRIKVDGKFVESKNEYVYYIDGQLISRQKVLNNAQKLLNSFKALNSDMLLYAMTRNSLIPKNKFEQIKQTITNYERSIQNGLSKTI